MATRRRTSSALLDSQPPPQAPSGNSPEGCGGRAGTVLPPARAGHWQPQAEARRPGPRASGRPGNFATVTVTRRSLGLSLIPGSGAAATAAASDSHLICTPGLGPAPVTRDGGAVPVEP